MDQKQYFWNVWRLCKNKFESWNLESPFPICFWNPSPVTQNVGQNSVCEKFGVVGLCGGKKNKNKRFCMKIMISKWHGRFWQFFPKIVDFGRFSPKTCSLILFFPRFFPGSPKFFPDFRGISRFFPNFAVSIKARKNCKNCQIRTFPEFLLFGCPKAPKHPLLPFATWNVAMVPRWSAHGALCATLDVGRNNRRHGHPILARLRGR